MHRLITELGWPLLLVTVYVAGVATPGLIGWIRFEIRLTRRVRRYQERMEAARVARVRW